MPTTGSFFVLSCSLLAFTLGSAGCARDLARASSGAIGCPVQAIEITNVSVGWSLTSWKARCHDTDFYCSGESTASCAPERLEPSSTHLPTITTSEPR